MENIPWPAVGTNITSDFDIERFTMLTFLYFEFDFAPGFGFQLILASHELRLEIDY